MNKEHIKNLIGDNVTIFEIGCNDGSDTIEFLKVFDNVTIHCFEPDNRAISKFKNNINDKRVILNEIAISNKIGTIEFNQSNGNNGIEDNWDKSGSIKKPTNHIYCHPWCKFEQKIIVNTTTLDEYCKNINTIDFIWADVQGAEDLLIEGGLETLKHKVKYFYTEFSDLNLYENELNLNGIKELLFPYFDLVEIIDNNVLFKKKV